MEEIEKLKLKVQALGESFSSKAVGYENQIADLRVELTLLSRQYESAKLELEERANAVQPEDEE